MTILGNMPTSAAVANTVAEPVLSVSHQIRANCTSSLPKSEIACALHTVKNGRAHFLFIGLLRKNLPGDTDWHPPGMLALRKCSAL